MHFLGCLFVLLFGGLLFILAFAGVIIDNILVLLGLKKRRQPFGGYGTFGQQDRQYGPFNQQRNADDFDSVDSDSAGSHQGSYQQQGASGPQQGGKIFQKDDSEYVDFEEV